MFHSIWFRAFRRIVQITYFSLNTLHARKENFMTKQIPPDLFDGIIRLDDSQGDLPFHMWNDVSAK